MSFLSTYITAGLKLNNARTVFGIKAYQMNTCKCKMQPFTSGHVDLTKTLRDTHRLMLFHAPSSPPLLHSSFYSFFCTQWSLWPVVYSKTIWRGLADMYRLVKAWLCSLHVERRRKEQQAYSHSAHFWSRWEIVIRLWHGVWLDNQAARCFALLSRSKLNKSVPVEFKNHLSKLWHHQIFYFIKIQVNV